MQQRRTSLTLQFCDRPPETLKKLQPSSGEAPCHKIRGDYRGSSP